MIYVYKFKAKSIFFLKCYIFILNKYYLCTEIKVHISVE